MRKHIVMRHACLMEDEGRHSRVRDFDTRQEAAEWISRQEGEYFTPSDYYIVSPQATLWSVLSGMWHSLVTRLRRKK
jgi:hypothetical protein